MLCSPVSVIDRKESGSRMKLKTRLIIAFFVILFVPFLMFAVAFFGFSKYQMRMIEQSYGVPMSLESLTDSMQVIGKSTEQIFNKLKVQAKEDPDQFLDNGAEDAYELSVTEQTSKEQASADSVNEAEPVSESLYVYVCGAVATPGVYEVSVDSRIYEAVEQAGGMLDTAKTEAVNLAEPLTDGQMIRIPFQGEETVTQEDAATQNSGIRSDGKVNINTASAEELMTLKGIGQTRAEQIIAYREKHGAFASIEGIMEVDGIKQGTFDKLKDNITVQ